MKLTMSYLLNKKLKNHSEKVFEGISRGRKKALENWFKDKWVELELARDTISAINEEEKSLSIVLAEKISVASEFCELFILDDKGIVRESTFRNHNGMDMSDFPNYLAGINGEPLMYGPYEDSRTLDIDLSRKKFFDEVTLLFSLPYKNYKEENRILCARVLNDDMSNVIQDEDTHIYKDSGDNYLFMIKSNRGIVQGTAISRSRFEDNTFTLGDNLKAGIKTSKWGVVKIEKHTEFEIVFNDPETGELHQGLKKTIQKSENLDCWPGYPDYRHIMVGGKGTIINPPNCTEVWGMMCEGDVAEIYNFRSIGLKIPLVIGVFSGTLMALGHVISLFSKVLGGIGTLAIWLSVTVISYIIAKNLVVKPLNRTVNILQEIAEGEGDLTKRVKKLSSDEIGELSRWFNKFLNNQMMMIKRMGSASNKAKQSSEVVASLTKNLKKSMKVIEETVDTLLGNSKKQNKIFQKTKERFGVISASIQEMDSLLSEVVEKTQNTNSYAVDANRNSEEVLNSMKELEDTMEETLGSIGILEQRSKEISEVINVINTISKQTKLLALNATIEAARAGEVGKGFAVVAEEISKLAANTGDATISISELISSVQEEAETTLKNVNLINEKVVTSTEGVRVSIDTFQNMQKDITYVSNKLTSISEITNMQSIDINDVLLSTSEVAEKIKSDTKKSENSSETSLSLVEGILGEIKQLEQASTVLEHSSDNLSDMVNGFKLF